MKKQGTVLLFDTKQAMESLRASGHDLYTALAEPIDNSLQAGSRRISLKVDSGKNEIHSIAIGDDGDGMAPAVLPKAIGLGSSTRYGDRSGIGRFGVGGILGGISQARRIEYYSRSKKTDDWHYSYLDIDELAPEQREIEPSKPKAIPKEFSSLVGETGTLVIWSKCDRITIEGKRAKSIDVKMITNNLMHFLGRTYRKFIDGGISVSVNGVEVSAYDPLFLMTTARFPHDPKAEKIVDESFDWQIGDDPKKTSKVYVKMTILPEEWRLKRGEGDPRRNPIVKERRIHENEGLSILRADREIFYGILPKFYPGQTIENDRFFSIEISFSPELDENFAVRNVKKGAEPIEELRNKLKQVFDRAIKTARLRIKECWAKTDAKENTIKGLHHKAEEAAARANKTAPKANVGKDVDPKEQEERLKKAAEVLKNNTDSPDPVETIKENLKLKPLSIIDETWPTKDLFVTEHISENNSILRLNNNHPFYRLIYQKIQKAIEKVSGESDDNSSVCLSKEDLSLVLQAVDLILLSYMKAESVNVKHDQAYSDLKHHWGVFLFNCLEELRSHNETQ